MVIKYMIGILGIAILMGMWIVVQGMWRKVFSSHMNEDQDVLAGRTDCGSCGCSTPCSVKTMNNKIKA